MTAELEVRIARDGDEEAREAFCRSHEEATIFHRAGWGRVIERVFGHPRRDLIALEGDEVRGLLPLSLCRGPLGHKSLISVPYGVYGGPLAADEASEAALLDFAVGEAERTRVGRLELRTQRAPAACADWPASALYSTFQQELPEDPAQVLGSIPKKARAEARKARQRHGLELVEGCWYVDDLYRMFHKNKRKLGSPGLPLALFRGLLGEFGSDVTVHLVRRGREPLAAVMSFLDGQTLRAYYAGTEDDADRTYSASNFMYMALREWAVERGFRVFDFGRSRSDAGAFAFKRHQGFDPTPLDYRYHLVRDRGLPSFHPSNPRTEVLRKTWSRLPPWLAARLSERLARYLP